MADNIFIADICLNTLPQTVCNNRSFSLLLNWTLKFAQRIKFIAYARPKLQSNRHSSLVVCNLFTRLNFKFILVVFEQEILNGRSVEKNCSKFVQVDGFPSTFNSFMIHTLTTHHTFFYILYKMNIKKLLNAFANEIFFFLQLR